MLVTVAKSAHLSPITQKYNKPFVNGAGHKLAALNVTQNELLVTQDIMSRQNDVVHARNTEGKAGWIADTQIQLVEPGMKCMHNFTLSLYPKYHTNLWAIAWYHMHALLVGENMHV